MRPSGPLVAILSLAAASISAAGYPLVGQTPSDRTAAVLTAAHAALGGDAKIASVKTFVTNGRTRQVRGDNLIPIEFEISVELPDKYARRDEFPAQDNGPQTVGFNGDILLLDPPAPPPPARGGAPPPTPEQQEAARRNRVAGLKQDVARLLLGMFASSFSSYPVTFDYVAQAESPQGKADVLDVTGPANFRARLFINAETHLPVLLTWQTPAPPARGAAPPPGPPAGPPAGPPLAGPPTGPPMTVEQRMYFADYRETDGLRLPFRIRRAVGADTIEETTFDRFRINTRIDARRFQPRG
jgi:hypothetical protein